MSQPNADTPAGGDSPFDSLGRRLGAALTGAKHASSPATGASRSDQATLPTATDGRTDVDPFDSLAGRLGNALKTSSTPSALAGGVSAPPAHPPSTAPAPREVDPFDSLAGRLNHSLESAVSAVEHKAEATPPADEVDPYDSLAGRLDTQLKDAVNASETTAQTEPAAPPPESAGPVGTGEYNVKQGECISSIAKEKGHFWETIWNDAANSVLRETRQDPNVLLPGDRVYIPPLREKWARRQTEMRHRFRRRGEPAMLRLTLQYDDEPLANQPYTLDIDGQTFEGITDAGGKLERTIPNNARGGRLVVGTVEPRTFELDLGHIDPVENLVGVQKRLMNLGFQCTRQDGEWDAECKAALRDFQRSQGIPVTGDPDQATREKLRQVHGS